MPQDEKRLEEEDVEGHRFKGGHEDQSGDDVEGHGIKGPVR